MADINGIVDKFDALVAANNEPAIQELKAIFGLGNLQSNLDFAYTIALPGECGQTFETHTNCHSWRTDELPIGHMAGTQLECVIFG